MKWYKHDANANCDAKLRRVRLKYGMEGYGLYWYCLELVAQNVEKHNLTFELEHDAEIIAADTGIHFELVQEMMTYMVDLGLFEQQGNNITCLKLAKRTDEYTQKLINSVGGLPILSRQSPDKVRSNRTEQKRLEQNRTEQTNGAINKPAWFEYVQHRKEIKKAITPLSEKKQQNVLRQFDFESQQKLVDTTIANGWTGIFPDRLRNAGRKLTYSEQLAEDINATNK